jgi:hypothetical protein
MISSRANHNRPKSKIDGLKSLIFKSATFRKWQVELADRTDEKPKIQMFYASLPGRPAFGPHNNGPTTPFCDLVVGSFAQLCRPLLRSSTHFLLRSPSTSRVCLHARSVALSYSTNKVHTGSMKLALREVV